MWSSQGKFRLVTSTATCERVFDSYHGRAGRSPFDEEPTGSTPVVSHLFIDPPRPDFSHFSSH